MFDAFQVINYAIKIEPCSAMNGSSIISKDMNAMLTCMKKVSTLFERMDLILLNLYHTQTLSFALLMRQILKKKNYLRYHCSNSIC